MSDFNSKHQSCYEKLDSIVDMHGRLLKQLQTFLLQTKEVQSLIYQDLLDHNSYTEEVLRQIINDEVNRDTIMANDSFVDDMVRKEEKDFYSDSNHRHK